MISHTNITQKLYISSFLIISSQTLNKTIKKLPLLFKNSLTNMGVFLRKLNGTKFLMAHLTICGITWTKQTLRNVFNNTISLQLFCSFYFHILRSQSIQIKLLQPHSTIESKHRANLQGPCLLVSQTHELVRRLKAINSSVLKKA